MKVKLATLLLIIISINICSEDLNVTDVLPKQEETGSKDGNPTKEEKKILAILVAGYSKIRTIVRYAYDEYQYYKELRQQAERLKQWWQRGKDIVSNIKDQGAKLKDGDLKWWDKVLVMRDIVDGVDELTIGQAVQFDNICAGYERTFDKMVVDTFSYRGKKLSWTPGALIPNTDQIVNFYELRVLKDSSSLKSGLKTSSFNGEEEINRSDNGPARIDTTWIETKVRDAMKYISASAQARSSMYLSWEAKASLHDDLVESQLDQFTGVNKTEMIAAYYNLERINALAKLVDHSAQELKALQGLLGYEMYSMGVGVRTRMDAVDNASRLYNAAKSLKD
ncbi:MAG: hypothetical protein GX640_04200 [Fibrobacter sp.]|nr:hypothetical protein [Fibrobacter sp.]